MYPISELIETGTPSYLAYVSKKTGYIVTRNPQHAQYIWRQLTQRYAETNSLQQEGSEVQKGLYDLLDGFGYATKSEGDLAALEKQVPFVFAHPEGGYFIPLEVLKLLMQYQVFAKEGFLFGLLYRLGKKELKSMASIVGGRLEAQLSVTFEKHVLDMALVLYIWLANQQMQETTSFFSRGRLLRTPYAFLREEPRENGRGQQVAEILPHNPVPLWEHLYHYFPHCRREIDEWRHLMQRGHKGFYRSLGLIQNTDSELFEAFRLGLLMPVVSGKQPLMLVSPREIRAAEFMRQFNPEAFLQRKRERQ